MLVNSPCINVVLLGILRVIVSLLNGVSVEVVHDSLVSPVVLLAWVVSVSQVRLVSMVWVM